MPDLPENTVFFRAPVLRRSCQARGGAKPARSGVWPSPRRSARPKNRAKNRTETGDQQDNTRTEIGDHPDNGKTKIGDHPDNSGTPADNRAAKRPTESAPQGRKKRPPRPPQPREEAWVVEMRQELNRLERGLTS